MFGTVLEKLSALLSKSFVVANFFPTLIFVVANGAMLFLTSGSFRAWVLRHYQPDSGAKAILLVTVLIGIAVLAYVLSPLNLTLRELMEGHHWPRALAEWGESWHLAKMDHMKQQFAKYQSKRRDLDRYDAIGRKLRDARSQGQALTACTFSQQDPAAIAVRNLLEQRSRAKEISPDDLERGAESLVTALAHGNADITDPRDTSYGASSRLDQAHMDFFKVWKYADIKVQATYIRYYNELQFNYGRDELAPTAMGNTAITVRDYAESRYGLNLDVFWSRLQKVLQKDEKFYGVLQDAKTQLDFLVLMFWFTVLFGATWAVALVSYSYIYLPFLLVVVISPWLAAVFYALALQNSRALADLLRSSVDLFRLQLLNELHIPLPGRPEEEIELWTMLSNRIGFDHHDKNMSYRHPSTT